MGDCWVELNLRLIQVLAVAAQEHSMTRAAARLSLTQQAVSAQIRQLERIVGVALLVRTSRGVALTPAGQVVAERGAALLRDAEQLVSEAQMAAQGRAGRLRVAFKAQSTAHFMPAVVAAVGRATPDIHVEVVSVSTLSEQIELLTEDRADAAFVWLPVGFDHLASAEILTERRVVALPPDHRLAGKDALTLADVADEPVVGAHSLVPREVARFWAVDPRPGGTAAVYGPEGRTPEECLQLVATHRGVWIAPASSAAYFAQPRLAWVPLVDAEPFRLALAWPEHATSPLLHAFVRHCRALATTVGGGASAPHPPASWA